MIDKPNFHSRSVFSEHLVAIEMRKFEIKLDKLIYMGMCILDISKTCLYEFHHAYMLPLYHEKYKIMYTDTDSFIYHIECDNVYDIIKHDIAKFDTSDYPTENAYVFHSSLKKVPVFLSSIKKVPGLMKDENNGAIMIEFVGLRAKMYALRVDGKKDTKKVKGVKSNVITSKPRRFCFYELEGKRKRRYGRTQTVTDSQVYAQRRVLRVERTFMAPEYGLTSRKDAMTPLSTSSAVVGSNSSQGT